MRTIVFVISILLATATGIEGFVVAGIVLNIIMTVIKCAYEVTMQQRLQMEQYMKDYVFHLVNDCNKIEQW